MASSSITQSLEPRPSSWPIRRERQRIAHANMHYKLETTLKGIEDKVTSLQASCGPPGLQSELGMRLNGIDAAIQSLMSSQFQTLCAKLDQAMENIAVLSASHSESSARVDRLETLLVCSPSFGPSVDTVLNNMLPRKLCEEPELELSPSKSDLAESYIGRISQTSPLLHKSGSDDSDEISGVATTSQTNADMIVQDLVPIGHLRKSHCNGNSVRTGKTTMEIEREDSPTADLDEEVQEFDEEPICDEDPNRPVTMADIERMMQEFRDNCTQMLTRSQSIAAVEQDSNESEDFEVSATSIKSELETDIASLSPEFRAMATHITQHMEERFG